MVNPGVGGFKLTNVAIKCGEEARLGKVVALPFRGDSSVEPGNGRHLLQTSDF